MKETIFNTVVAAAATVATSFLGGWDEALTFLITFMTVDLVTGFLAAMKAKKVDSDVMFWGGIRKGIILIAIGIAVKLDIIVGNESPLFRTMAIYYYAGREGLSALENMGLLGVPLPKWMKDVLAQLADKGGSDSTEDNKEDK